jgi:hypothetical protein
MGQGQKLHSDYYTFTLIIIFKVLSPYQNLPGLFTSQNESFKHLVRLPKPACFDIYFGIGTAILRLRAIRVKDHARGHLRIEKY